MTSLPLTFPLYNPFLYSSLLFFSTSQDHPPRMTSPLWHSLFTFPFYTPLYCSSLTPLYSPFLHPLTPSLTHHYPLPTSPNIKYDYSPSDTPTLHSLFILLIFLPNIRNCCNGAAQLPLGFPAHRSQDHLPIWLAPLWHSLSTFTFYTPLYSSSLPPLYSPSQHPLTPSLTHHYPLPTSPNMTSPPLTIRLYIPFLSSLSICLP